MIPQVTSDGSSWLIRLATVALYGPNDTRATKHTVGIVPAEGGEVTDLRRWFSEGQIFATAGAADEVLAFIDAAGARSIAMTDKIIGCRLSCLPVLGGTRPLDW